MINNDGNYTGILVNPANVKLHRNWFIQMTKLLGIKVIYRAPLEGTKEYSLYGELDAKYEKGELIECIYDEHPSQKTMRMLGWNAEMAESTTIIHVPYDLKGLQVGGLFVIPSGLDNAEARVFRVLRMSNVAVYPASISCELGPVLNNEFKVIDSNVSESIPEDKNPTDLADEIIDHPKEGEVGTFDDDNFVLLEDEEPCDVCGCYPCQCEPESYDLLLPEDY